MVDDLVRSEAVEVDVTHLRRPLEVVECTVLVFVLDPTASSKGLTQVPVIALDDEDLGTLDSHRLLPSVQVPAFLSAFRGRGGRGGGTLPSFFGFPGFIG